jgi:cell division septal protein FtsQ
MTTLDVRMKPLRMAVAPFPVVKRLDVQTQFPHGMRIRVIEQVPVAVVQAAGRRTPVSGDGTLLHDVAATGSLPTISLGVAPGGTHLTGYALAEARMLSAAPYQLLGKVGQVSDGAAHGLVAQLRNGPAIYFGDSNRLAAKWTAAAEVLADPGSAGAVYLDVTDPSRPAAGSASDGTTASGSATSTPATAGGSASSTAATGGGSATSAPATASAPAGSTATAAGGSTTAVPATSATSTAATGG